MRTQVRSCCFESNSSSTHSVSVGEGEMMDDFGLSKETLRRGVIEVRLGSDYGWDWNRYYHPDEKLAYLLTTAARRCAGRLGSGDVTATLRGSSMAARVFSVVRRVTGCEVRVFADGLGEIDHASIGVGPEVSQDEDILARFLFAQGSYLQTGNDNSLPPHEIATDRGSERFVEGLCVDEATSGAAFECVLPRHGITYFVQPEGREAAYAALDDFEDALAVISALDGMTVTSAALWMPCPDSWTESEVQELGREVFDRHLALVSRDMPRLRALREAELEVGRISVAKSLSAWKTDEDSHVTLKAVTDPDKLEAAVSVLRKSNAPVP